MLHTCSNLVLLVCLAMDGWMDVSYFYLFLLHSHIHFLLMIYIDLLIKMTFSRDVVTMLLCVNYTHVKILRRSCD